VSNDADVALNPTADIECGELEPDLQPGIHRVYSMIVMTIRGLVVVVKIAILHQQTRVLQIFRDLFTEPVWSVAPTSQFLA
jgi:hypothetical protein